MVLMLGVFVKILKMELSGPWTVSPHPSSSSLPEKFFKGENKAAIRMRSCLHVTQNAAVPLQSAPCLHTTSPLPSGLCH